MQAIIRIRNIGFNGLGFALMGALIASTRKGSSFWLLGIVTGLAISLAMLWQQTKIVPVSFGTGIFVSYLGILWPRSYSASRGTDRETSSVAGGVLADITGMLPCLNFWKPNLLALADVPNASTVSINISLAASMLLLFAGHYLSRFSRVPKKGKSSIPDPAIQVLHSQSPNQL